MKIYKSIHDFKRCPNTTLTIGTFDGVHIGHQSIIHQLNKHASRINGESVLLTFHPHPRHVVSNNNNELQLLTTILERSKLLEEYGLQHLIIQEFTPEFSRMKPVHFVRDILVNCLFVHTLVVGYDHHFGRNRSGSFDELRSLSKLYDFELKKIEQQKIDNITVSSTKIRNALLNGQLKIANSLLGYHYMFSGVVIHGDKLGRKIGFPTANIKIENEKLIPAFGVYAVKVEINDCIYFGMMNIGVETYKTEVHIFDFDKQIYGEDITITMVAYLRDGKQINGSEDLRDQLLLDQEQCKSIFEILK